MQIYDDPTLKQKIARHYSDAFRLFGRCAPTGTHTEGNGWHRIVTKLPHFIANMAIIESGEAAEMIQEAVPPLVSPEFSSSVLFLSDTVASEIGKALDGNGFTDHSGMPMMAVDIHKVPATQLPAGFHFDEISTDDFSEWATAMDAGFSLPPGLGLMCAEPARQGKVKLFAAREGKKIVSTSMLFLNDGLAGIYCVSTLPEARGKGLGAHVTAEPLRLAAKQGFETGILQSSEAGYPIYKRLGFRDLGNIPIFLRRVKTEQGPS